MIDTEYFNRMRLQAHERIDAIRKRLEEEADRARGAKILRSLSDPNYCIECDGVCPDPFCRWED